MGKKILLMIALLCAVVQGAWADKWNGSVSRPTYDASRNFVIIRTGAELAYVHQHWDDDSGDGVDKDYYEHNYYLEDDLDLSDFVWTPLGRGGKQYKGYFQGNNHTITLVIEGATDNYQGLFADISSSGQVENLHVSGLIQCKDSRLVGGIAGQNDGFIRNCWVSADVMSAWHNDWSSSTAKVGGICGENNGTLQYCCMTGNVFNNDADVGGLVGYNTGTISHCTFYGERYSGHSQASEYVGSTKNNLWDVHGKDLFDDNTLNNYLSTVGNSEVSYIYRFAIQYPNPVNVYNEGCGAIETPFPGARVGKTVRLTKAYGASLKDIVVTDARGDRVSLSGNENNGYTFTIPRGGVVVQAKFNGTDWLQAHSGTSGDPFLINSTDDWNAFAYYVRQGFNFYTQFVKLNSDITATTMVGMGEEFPYYLRPFCGTFLGNGKTLTANLSSTATGTGWNEQGVAPFHTIFGATIKDLKVAGTISSASYHTAGIVGFAFDNNLIEGCTVTATLNVSNNYAGGIIGHGESSATTIKDCVFAGTINGIGASRANIGGIWGWSDSGTPVLKNCLEKGTYTGISSMHPMGLQGNSGSITDCYFLNPAIGTPDRACTVGGAWQVTADAPAGELYRPVTAANGTSYYLACEVSGINPKYFAAGTAVEPNPVVTWKGSTLGEDIDYSVSYANNNEAGTGTMTIRSKGNYSGEKSVPFTIEKGEALNTWWNALYTWSDGKTYQANGIVELDENRVTVEGNVVLVLGAGATLVCDYGIEVSEGSTLTIEGSGTLKVKANYDNSGIGAGKVGTIIINGGNIEATGGDYGAGIGGSIHNSNGGTIIINGGVVKATGGWGAAGIGGGYNNWQGNYGVCGNIVINGGQVTAIAGKDATFAIGRGQYGSDSGSLTLGWTKPDDFFQNASVAVKTITFADGKQFLIAGTQTLATPNNIGGKKIIPYVQAENLPGSGTESDPYRISSADEWNRFAKNVQYGHNYSGKFVKLTANIDVTRMCGYVSGSNPTNAFSGTFDGGGKTITVTLNDKPNQGMALFSYISGATIKNLTVAGYISSKQYHTSGLVGFASGTNLIEDCVVTTTLNIKSDYAGGIVGHGLTSATTLRNCIFAGTINGTDGKRSNIGGIWGWGDGGTPVLVNCLEKGTYNNINSMHPIGLQNTAGTITNSYYLNPAFGSPAKSCTVGGAYQASTTALAGEVSKQQKLMDGNAYYVPCVISGIDEYCELKNGSVSVTPTVSLPGGSPFTFDTDYTATLDGNTVTSFPVSLSAKGEHTLVITGKGACTGSKSFGLYVTNPITGDGTEGNPLLIRDIDDWNLFVTVVNRGTDFSGTFVKLDTDLTVTTMVGNSDNNSFKGTFLGGGHTLTFNHGTPSEAFGEDYCAPFRYVSGATIKDLNVAGDIYTYKKFATGLVGKTSGAKTTITNCRVSTVIHSSTEGDGTHAGIVALPNGELTITDCIYDGRLLTTKGTNNCAGFVGWHNAKTISISNSLYAPNTGIAPEGETAITVGATFVRGTKAGINCYYTEVLGEQQGRHVFTTAPEGELCVQAQAADGNMYYLPCMVSGIKETYSQDTENSIMPIVTGIDGNEQQPVFGTDYTATLDGKAVASLPFSIREDGGHTLTLTGISANYTGSKSVTFVVNGSLKGAGTAESPYLISSIADWTVLADNIANDTIYYRDKFVKLTTDLAVTKMVGTNNVHSFQGTFDGDGHTLTFTAGKSSEPFAEEYCAPFRYVTSATIKNLNVAGDIYTSKKFAAGLVGQPNGTTTITGCRVSTVIHSSIKGDGTHGGIVALPAGILTITDCIYDGRLLTTNGTNSCAGFVGWHNGQTISISNSLYAPKADAGQGETAITDGATFLRGASVGNYCYYTEPMGEAQGRQVYATLPDGELCIQAQAADGKMYYLPCTVGGVEASYMLEAGISITPTVTGLDGEEAQPVFGTDYTATLNGNKVESFPVSATAKGDYTLTLTGISDNYTGSKNVKFSVIASLNGEGSETNPYIVSDNADWMQLASKVAEGMNLSGQYVKLTNDIEIMTMMGVSEEKPFSATFLGNGHTLTANISNTNSDEQGQAPFHFIKDATIKDLTVAGTIASNSRHTAGLVGFASGTNLIEGCTVNATLNVSSDYAGGIIGHGLSSSTTIKDCIFGGTINGIGGDRPNMGGLWGWSDSGTPVLVNCLEKGTYTNISSMHPMGLQHKAGTITDCYYVNAQIGSPDHACTVGGALHVSATVPEDDIYKPVTAVDGETYYLLCTISGVCKVYQYTGSDITVTVSNITAADGTVLTEGTDYSCVISPAPVKEKGDYTMTISGQGSYSGTHTVQFAVSAEVPVTNETTVLAGNCTLYKDATIDQRIIVSGNAVLNLCEGATLTAPKGIELSKGNTLTINGPGSLEIKSFETDKSGIGAVEVGTLIINSGNITVLAGSRGAAIGGDVNNVSGGSITINGGYVYCASIGGSAIGGGIDDKVGHYGVSGDIVINGGQVKAVALHSAFGQGYQFAKDGDEGEYTSGTLTLGWNNPDDYIHDGSCFDASSQKVNVETVTFAPGKQFVIQGTTTIATPKSMIGATIVPYFTLKGKGTEEDPYTIGNTEEWNDFAGYVNNGYNFSGKHVKLTADSISATTLVGIDESHPFCGTFDGDSKTLFATISDTDNQGTALFRNISGATIKNVLVAGTVTGGMHAAAIVGFAKGKDNIMTNCAATASVSGGSHIGGLVGNALDGDIAITGCVYAGTMTGGDTAKGAILGWGVQGGTKTLTDCLYIKQDGQNTDNLDLVQKEGGNITVTNCYKTTMAEYEKSQEGQNARSLRSSSSPSEVPDNDEDYDITDLESYGIWANVYDVMPDYFGKLELDYGFLKVYEGGLEYEDEYYVACISIAANADNSAIISLATDYIVDVTLTDRTFSKDGTWSTLCLPFDIEDFTGTPLEGTKVMMLGNSEACETGFDASTGTLTLDFVEANEIEAGVPYIVKWDNTEGSTPTKLKNPMFRGVIIDDEAPEDHACISRDGNVQFVGTYSAVDIYTADKTNLYLGTDNTLYYPWGDGMTSYNVNACTAYFQLLNGLTAGDSSTGVRTFKLIFGGGEATSVTPNLSLQGQESEDWYSLDGRKLDGKPSVKGVYVNNGRKVVVK